MQLRTIFTLVIGSLVSLAMMAQSTNRKGKKVELEDIDVTFLSSYYQQDGNHSPVTGGIGTEQLTNIAPALLVNIPLDTANSLSAYGGVDFYSSASSDNIDNPNLLADHVSGASGSDVRGYLTLTYKNKNKYSGITKGITAGFSQEYDVTSLSAGALWSKTSKDNNRELGLKATYYFDNWRLIYPTELRGLGGTYLNTNQRHSINLSVTGSSLLNKRFSAAITGDFVYQTGLLSTPFHRVYFPNEELARVEQLPSTRIKVPLGVRLNYFATDFFILRTYYRYYQDSWSLKSHTAKIEAPLKITDQFRITPFYRYHKQSAAQYFAPYLQHSGDLEFYTADYDLSDFTSIQYGAGINIMPLFGLARYKSPLNRNKAGMLKNMEIRYSYYSRSDGLKASIISLALKFTIPQ
jgi:hypothetical protein